MNEILPNIYSWSVYSEEKKINFNGHLIASPDSSWGNVVIDPPQLSDPDLEQMKSLGPVEYILITNRNHVRWLWQQLQKLLYKVR